MLELPHSQRGCTVPSSERKPGYVKAFMESRKLSHKAGGKAFGNSPPTATWVCDACKGENLARKDKCRCGAAKPKPA